MMKYPTELRTIQKFLKAVQGDQPDVTVPRLMTLLEVAMREPVDQAALVRVLGQQPTATSKHIHNWTTLRPNKKKGPGYLESSMDPMMMTTRIISTTPKGRQALAHWLTEAGLA